MSLFYIFAVPLSLIILYLAWYLHVPWNLPRLPRIPFYVSILGLWSDMGQDEIYERWLRAPLEKHGAVLIWFAGRWSILVTRPDLLTDMFRNEDLYAKAGSQKKIPWSVIATLVGDNIINSHGDTWKLYTSIMKPGLQKKTFDSRPLLVKSRRFVDKILEDQATAGKQGILVNAYVQKWAVDVMGVSFLDMDLQSLEKPHGAVRLESIQSVIKMTLFRPLFFNFPDLDQFAWLLSSRKRAYEIMHEFGDTLADKVLAQMDDATAKGQKPEEEQVVHMLVAAYRDGRLTQKQFKDNLKIVFLTAHENAQQLVNSMFWEIGKNTEVQTRLRAEILATGTSNPTADIVNPLPYLTSVIYELMRLYPPVSQLINRVTTAPAMLGGQIPIPARTFVGWNSYGVHVNPQVWGADAQEFVPERWGSTVSEMHARFRRETVRGTYIPFNAHSRKCLGQAFVLLQMKILMFELLRRVEWRVDPGYKLKMTPGGILAPLGCRVILTEIQEKEK
ncbi:cytochrome P450 monooxygenase xanG [Aspergillus clavatus NRRL 1]|uniref:Sporulation-specific N-formyltyrosine oxidase Dit2, putative n=1 Tax=Aspergillus clavatus (strain ATCC 1007 / CBS 513.65 / DSM 816 / NCTC 3887 / NRRL 1 / QM 1276 / 107) TaxID=344612 RepID=A1C575_ASPCL|nr:sporulation-specific N-formyltyrosine oxidase Dit2, putative [Aspergillus clavatus NRRL 1]EAW14843.1 sporulation-specific N-formyltyrosine oxidase Dit2, putative [Aspergillus clavatus NRRL 1]